MARKKTNLVHFRGTERLDVSREIGTEKLFIKNTNEEIQKNQVLVKRSNKNYDFSKPAIAQNLGDEWDDYAWTADDF